jgi:hypothetical protein
VGCFVTSAEWLDVNYGSIIRQLLVQRLGGESLFLVDPKSVPFDDAMTTAAIACFRAESTPSSMVVRKVSSVANLEDLTRGRRIKTSRLADSKRWSSFLHSTQTRKRTNTMPLGEVARVHRGVVTGCNQFFVLKPQQADELGLRPFCKPAVTSGKQVYSAVKGVLRLTENTDLLLDLTGDEDLRAHPELAEYLAHGERIDVDKRYITSKRRPWWRVAVKKAPPIIASYMARQAPVFALNPDELVLVNIAHGIYPREKMSKRSLTRLVNALNEGRLQYRGNGRTYHGGLEKFEPREMEALPIPRNCL